MNFERRYKFMVTMILTFTMVITLCVTLLCVEMSAASITNHDKKIGMLDGKQLNPSTRAYK